MINKSVRIAALFDLDGVIVDTEELYSRFWQQIGECYFPEKKDFASVIKGSTLTKIMQEYFSHDATKAEDVCRKLDEWEATMTYDYIDGAEQFIHQLHDAGVEMAIVTSSNDKKMEQVYRSHPELKELFQQILTADDITASKPDPQCYLKAAEMLGVDKDDCVVFEDSLNGLHSGRNAHMRVVGLATTLPFDEVEKLADVTIKDFRSFGLDDMKRLLNK